MFYYRVLFLLALFLFLFPLNAFSLCVKADKANLRKGPGKRYKKTWVVGKYMPFIKIHRKGNWIKVRDLDKEEHWIHKKLVTGSFNCVVVKNKRAALYSGPGKKYSRSSYHQADKYTPFKRLEKKSHWYHVEDGFGQKAWVHRNQVWRPVTIAHLKF